MKASDLGGATGGFDTAPEGTAQDTTGAGDTGGNLQTTYHNTQYAIQLFLADLQQSNQSMGRVMESLQSMITEVEILHHQYEEVRKEKMYLEQLLLEAESRTADVRNIVQRFADVKDAVVASDGFTYERHTITDYINKCLQAGNRPVSQRADTILTYLLIPNRSLKTLLDRLIDILRSTSSGAGDEEGGATATTPAHVHGGGDGKPNVAKASARVETPSSQVDLRARDGVTGTSGNGPQRREGAAPEVNAKGERVHPCLRVYGYCNYNNSCAYAKYPYDACLSHLKGKCRFRNQCHERHVEYRGPLNDDGTPLHSAENAAAEKKETAGATTASASAAVANRGGAKEDM